MASPRLLCPLPLLLLSGLLSSALPGPASAGPLVRRAQERRACQEFAGKLQQASGNPAMAQQVYQQGVLQLVQRFGENPCGDIPAPTASGTPGAPASAPATSTPAPGAPAGTPAATAAPASTTATPATPTPAATSPAASAQQQQACQQFAGKLQSAAASGGAAAAQQTYAMGLQKLTGMFGANPCPGITPPR
ncbi:hypothetical protein NZK32_06475 [Cyanobium sp. FGCU-52]|nr:hypothetical protein [Cyanobium sp. FGCU52]